MDLYEHMGKDLFRAQGIPTPAGRVCRIPEEAADAARAFGGPAVVKVQVQVGGRGKGGGVELCRSPDAAAAAAERMLRDGFMGHVVDRVLAEELLPIAQEFYTSIVLDRSTGGYLAMMTAEGGVEIETLARERPETIRRVQIDPLLGLRSYHVRELTGALPVAAREGAADVVRKLFELLWERDATLAEVQGAARPQVDEPRLLVAADDADVDARFVAGGAHELTAVLRLTHGAGRDRHQRVDLVAIDDPAQRAQGVQPAPKHLGGDDPLVQGRVAQPDHLLGPVQDVDAAAGLDLGHHEVERVGSDIQRQWI